MFFLKFCFDDGLEAKFSTPPSWEWAGPPLLLQHSTGVTFLGFWDIVTACLNLSPLLTRVGRTLVGVFYFSSRLLVTGLERSMYTIS